MNTSGVPTVWWGTITYEVFCVLGRLNPRVYT